MNLVVQVCTLGADPTVKTYGDGKTLVTFNGAVPRRFKKEGEPDTDWFKDTAFGSTADFISKYFHKGSKMLVKGVLQNNNYEKEDGTKVYSSQIVVDAVEFYGSKSDSANAEGGAKKTTEKSASKAEKTETDTSSFDSYDDF